MSESTPAKAFNDDAAATKAQRIEDKIAASSARSSGRAPARASEKTARASEKTARSSPKQHPAARDGADGRSFLTRALDDHPLALLAGGVLLGAVAASLIPASVTRKLGSRMFSLAALAGEMSALYGGKALEKGNQAARAGQDRLEDLGETAADYSADARARAIELGTLAAHRAIELATGAASNARSTGGGLVKRLSDLADRARS